MAGAIIHDPSFSALVGHAWRIAHLLVTGGAVGQVMTADAGAVDGWSFKSSIGLNEATPATAGAVAATLGSNGATAYRVKRQTDASPTGLFLDFQSAAGASLFTVNIAGQIVAGALRGTTTNDNAAAGFIGEIIVSEVLGGAAVSLTTGTAADVTSISLTAGDWDVDGAVWFSSATGTIQTQARAWTSVTAATIPTPPNKGGQGQSNATFTASTLNTQSAGVQRFSLAGTTTIFMGCFANFTVSTMTAYGYLRARRAR